MQMAWGAGNDGVMNGSSLWRAFFFCAGQNGVVMEKIDIRHADAAMSSMQALHSAMTLDLGDIEQRMETLAESPTAHSAFGIEEMSVYYVARAALYSGLASINEILGWVHLMTEKDSEGNVSDAVKSLPTVPVFSIH
jgi:hypothetical protein